MTLPGDLFDEFGCGYLRYEGIKLADESECMVPALDIRVVEFAAPFRTAILLPGKPLLGMGYLKGHRVTIDATEGGKVLIEPLAGAPEG